MALVGLFCVFALFSACSAAFQFHPTLTYSNSDEVIKRFPHHVTIGKISLDGSSRLCSGSVIHKNWILSSYQCLRDGVQYRVNLRRENLMWIEGQGFSVLVGNSSVYHYPTLYDDISLLQLPMNLLFSRRLQPIALDSGRTHLENKFAVIASLPENDYSLEYGMYRVTEKCDLYADKYLQLCTLPWGTDSKLLSDRSSGAALVIDWPQRPRLIGIFSYLSENSSVAVYTRISSYIDWIQFIVPGYGGTTTTTPFPTTYFPTQGSRDPTGSTTGITGDGITPSNGYSTVTLTSVQVTDSSAPTSTTALWPSTSTKNPMTSSSESSEKFTETTSSQATSTTAGPTPSTINPITSSSESSEESTEKPSSRTQPTTTRPTPSTVSSSESSEESTEKSSSQTPPSTTGPTPSTDSSSESLESSE